MAYDRSMPPYDWRRSCRDIARHAHKKHVKHESRFRDLGINNRKDFQRHARDTLLDPSTKAFKATNGRDIFYNEISQTVVICHVPRAGADGRISSGTCYRASHQELDRLRRKEAKAQGVTNGQYFKAAELDKSIPLTHGGIKGLYPKLDISRKYTNQETLAYQRQKADALRKKQEAIYKQKQEQNQKKGRSLTL